MRNIFIVKCKFDIWKLLICILATESVGILSSFFTMCAEQIYLNLNKPAFAPPASVFGPVWIFLYFLMGIAAYRIWMYGTCRLDVKNALMFYVIQLVFNFLWSVSFFGSQLIGVAFLVILLLLILIIVTTVKFQKIDKIAANLMLPYIFWVAFAAILNLSIWILNMNVQITK